MPTLVLPDRTVQRIPDKAALKIWAADRGIAWKLRENISQLLRFDPSPTAGTTTGRSRGDHFLLEDTTWMYHANQPKAIPLFGSYPNKFQQLKAQASIGFSLATFKRLDEKRGQPSDDGWWVGNEPAAVAFLPDGGSLRGIDVSGDDAAAPAAQPPLAQLPDYGARMGTAFLMHTQLETEGQPVEVRSSRVNYAYAWTLAVRSFLPEHVPAL